MLQATVRLHDADAEWAAWNARQISTYQPRHVPPERREHYAATTSLRQFYLDCSEGRWEPVGRKKGRSKGTVDKERQALNRWEKYTRPEDWPSNKAWPGPNLAMIETISAEWFSDLYDKMLAGGLSNGSVKSTRSHLNVLINHATAVKAILKSPQTRAIENRDLKKRIYTPDEVTKIFTVFEAVNHKLAIAFWVALHVGPRAEDLFTLRKSDVIQDTRGRRLIEFEARKTAKLQAIPISDETWQWIQPLTSGDSPYLFHDLTSPQALNPEKSYRARARNSLVKQLLASVGITDVDRPWQIARRTCNERYESHRPGVGEFITGHGKQGVNARSYREPTEAVHEAVRTLPPYTQLERQLRLF
ncbi:hypothetical protein Pan44_26360 [Caulifigura coniformis]|uniref:Phage integrase family protein n=1 Tax=Caulifigura coniformis TaxID=2527983 RepID=A0A517SEN6_9PLAN|nr:hypothetical protein [Caulifigura coniformis]QDT54602.1 hypothetical protein Pan44_26360 [Caulifigura coniformis]